MQDWYAGDVGDFGKLALLRAVSAGRRLGVCWYFTAGESKAGNDGRHLGYLDRPKRFRHLDPPLFDALAAYRADVRSGRRDRSIESLEQLGLLPGTTRFHRTVCPGDPAARAGWADEMAVSMRGADLVFLGPDNGLEDGRLAPKSAALAELTALRAPGRVLLLYHHQSRRRGGAAAELAHIAGRLSAGFDSIQAIRFRPYSSCFYCLLDGNEALSQRVAASLCANMG